MSDNPQVHPEYGEISTPDADNYRAQMVEVSENIIRQWVETAYRITMATIGESDCVARSAVRGMRHLHLAQPYLPAIQIADAIMAISAKPKPFSERPTCGHCADRCGPNGKCLNGCEG